MKELFPNSPGFILLFQVIYVGSCAVVGLLGTFVLPWILNRKFDLIFGPKKSGEEWEIGKNPAYPAYFYYRASDYALAVIKNSFAEKKFMVPSAFFRKELSLFSIILCWMFKIAQYVFGACMLLVVVFLVWRRFFI